MAKNGECLDNLTDEQKDIYAKFRSEVKDLIQPSFDDYFVWKWIKATNYNIEKAKTRFQEHLKFRKRYGLDTILQDFVLPEVVKKHYCHRVLGFDSSGNIVMLALTGFCDMKGLARSLTVTDQMKSYCYFNELFNRRLEEENKKTGRNARKLVVIADLKGMNFTQLLDSEVRKGLLDLSSLMENHYPEMLQCHYFINAPVFFHAWYNIFKNFLDPSIVKKIQVYAGGGGWMESLRETIDPDIIPAFIGGNLTDPDGNPECNTMFTRIPEVPASYYLKNNCGKLKSDPLAKAVTVKERFYYNQLVYVKEKNAELTWCFETVDHDIGFAVYYFPPGVKTRSEVTAPRTNKLLKHRVKRNSKDGHVILVPLERTSCQHHPETGELACEEIGTYVLHFDNTYSWLTPKTLYFKVQLRFPSAEESNATDSVENTTDAQGEPKKCLPEKLK